MAGNFRSGRRPRAKTKTAEGLPKKPRKLSKEEKWCWDNVVLPGSQLGEMDTALCWACCELWGLYRGAVEAAKHDPGDKDLRIAVNSYATQFRDTLVKLGLDPLGRERMRAKSGVADEPGSNPLQDFGIIG